MRLGHIDYYLPKPADSPDEYFHRTLADFLHEWRASGDTTTKGVAVVAETGSMRARELVGLLSRCDVPYTSIASDSAEGRRLMEQAGHGSSQRPMVAMPNGRVLFDPSNAELASGYGVMTELEGSREFDLVVVGAGPAGLAAAVYASSEGLRTLVIEGEAVGGQAGTSALIRNYLGFSRGVRGGELAQRAFQQAWVFGAQFLHMHWAQEVISSDGEHSVRVSNGETARARAVILATGISYERMPVPALEDLIGAGVYYGASISEAQSISGKDAYVVGGGNSAGQAALHISRYARRVTLLVRGTALGDSMSGYLSDQLSAEPKIDVRLETEITEAGGSGRLEWLRLRDRRTGAIETVPAHGAFILIGARPDTGWLPLALARDRSGYIATGPDLLWSESREFSWPLGRPPLAFETNLPGVFAVGDVRHRSTKRVASAVGEGSVVVQQVHQYLAGEAKTCRLGLEGATLGTNLYRSPWRGKWDADSRFALAAPLPKPRTCARASSTRA